MKERVTQFDFDSAFKALDEIETPKVKGLKANRLNLKESVRRVDRLSKLIEDYYDVQSNDDMQQASEDRAGEIAKAKLSRIEKIVDLDAESEDDILPSYAGKIICQCPQCMTLFYKNSEDVVESADDPTIINVEEVCQHCGNTDGYTIIGKVAEASPEEVASELSGEETEVGSEENEENYAEEIPEEDTEETPEGEEVDISNLGSSDTGSEENYAEEETEEMPEEPEENNEEELKESAFFDFLNNSYLMEQIEDTAEDDELDDLNETLDPDLKAKLEAHNEYIEYIQKEIDEATAELEKAVNPEIKASIQSKIEALKASLDEAIPEAVKNGSTDSDDELPDADEIPEEAIEGEIEDEEEAPEENNKKEKELSESISKPLRESEVSRILNLIDGWSTQNYKKDDTDPDLVENRSATRKHSDAELLAHLRSDETRKNVDPSDVVIEDLDRVEDFDSRSFDECVTKHLTETYKNVKSFTSTDCTICRSNLIIEGVIKFKSGKQKVTTFKFKPSGAKNKLAGLNEDFKNSKFELSYFMDRRRNHMLAESLSYNYKIGKNKIKGKVSF